MAETTSAKTKSSTASRKTSVTKPAKNSRASVTKTGTKPTRKASPKAMPKASLKARKPAASPKPKSLATKAPASTEGPRAILLSPAAQSKLRELNSLKIMHHYTLGIIQTHEPEIPILQQAIMSTVLQEQGVDWSIRALAEKLGQTKPTVTRAVDALETLGLVKRFADPADARGVFVRLLAKTATWFGTQESIMTKPGKGFNPAAQGLVERAPAQLERAQRIKAARQVRSQQAAAQAAQTEAAAAAAGGAE